MREVQAMRGWTAREVADSKRITVGKVMSGGWRLSVVLRRGIRTLGWIL